MAVGMMPLWFWTAWQLLGLGLMVFGAVVLVMALRENKKGSAGRQPGQSRGETINTIISTASIAEKKGNVK